jgi:GNAT superfamily N-acetyltransferase
MIVVPAALEDLAAVSALVNRAYRGESSRAGWTTEADLLTGVRTDAASLAQELAASPGAVILTLRDAAGAAPVGSVWLKPQPDEEGVWYLGLFAVEPTRQAGGLGRRLLEAAEAYARERGGRRMRMTVIAVRAELIAWYQRRGYQLTGAFAPFPYDDERVGTPLGQGLRLAVMERRLQ